MNRLLIASVLFLATFGIVGSGMAQEFAQPYKKFEIGPFGTGGLSVFFGDVPDGSKTDIHAAWTAGVFAAYSFKPEWGVGLGLGYESRGMYFHQESKDVPNTDFTLNYFTIQPSLKFKNFLLGVNIGIPVSNTAESNFGSTSLSNSFGGDTVNTLLDIRIAGMLPIVENDGGNLDFIIQASYCLSDAIGKGGFLTPGQTDITKPVTGSPIPTVQIGLSYLFSPMGKE